MTEYTTPGSADTATTQTHITAHSSIGNDTPGRSRGQAPPDVNLHGVLDQHSKGESILDWFARAKQNSYTWHAIEATLCDKDVQVTYHLTFAKRGTTMHVNWYPNREIFYSADEDDYPCLVAMRASMDGKRLTGLFIDSFFYHTDERFKRACPWTAKSTYQTKAGDPTERRMKIRNDTDIEASRKLVLPGGVPPPRLCDCFPLYFAETANGDGQQIDDEEISPLQAYNGYGLLSKFGFAVVHAVLKLLMPDAPTQKRMELVNMADVFEGKFGWERTEINSEMLRTETLASIYLKELIGKRACNRWALSDGLLNVDGISRAVGHIREVGYYWGIMVQPTAEPQSPESEEETEIRPEELSPADRRVVASDRRHVAPARLFQSPPAETPSDSSSAAGSVTVGQYRPPALYLSSNESADDQGAEDERSPLGFGDDEQRDILSDADSSPLPAINLSRRDDGAATKRLKTSTDTYVAPINSEGRFVSHC